MKEVYVICDARAKEYELNYFTFEYLHITMYGLFVNTGSSHASAGFDDNRQLCHSFFN